MPAAPGGTELSGPAPGRGAGLGAYQALAWGGDGHRVLQEVTDPVSSSCSYGSTSAVQPSSSSVNAARKAGILRRQALSRSRYSSTGQLASVTERERYTPRVSIRHRSSVSSSR